MAETRDTAAKLRALLSGPELTHAPGIYDPATAALAVRAGHRAVHLSAAAVAATMLARTDAAFTSATEIADRAAVLAPTLGPIPLLADAPAGFDRPDQAIWTALAYQRAGITGLILDDIPATAGPRPEGSAAAGSGAAALGAERIARLVAQVPDMVIIARVCGDSPYEVFDRCRRYAAAGADALLPVGIDDFARLHAALPGVPLVSEQRAAGPGVRLVLHPLDAVLAALRAASLAYRAIAEQGTSIQVDQLPAAVFETLLTPPPPSVAVAAEVDRIDT